MSIEYLSDGETFSLSYKELRNCYDEFCDMEDEEFLNKLPDALHLACMICFLKEVPTYICLTDKGVIHELIHLLKNQNVRKLKEIRDLFKMTLRLA